jgi:hypothetical protein
MAGKAACCLDQVSASLDANRRAFKLSVVERARSRADHGSNDEPRSIIPAQHAVDDSGPDRKGKKGEKDQNCNRDFPSA